MCVWKFGTRIAATDGQFHMGKNETVLSAKVRGQSLVKLVSMSNSSRLSHILEASRNSHQRLMRTHVIPFWLKNNIPGRERLFRSPTPPSIISYPDHPRPSSGVYPICSSSALFPGELLPWLQTKRRKHCSSPTMTHYSTLDSTGPIVLPRIQSSAG